MPEKEFNKVFSSRLKYYLNKYEMTQAELAKRLGVGTTSVSDWCNGRKSPRMSKIDAMCEIFHCNRSDFLSESPETSGYEDAPAYYYDEDAANAAEFLYKNPEYKVLFDASRKVKAEDIDFVKRMIDRMNGDDGSDA